MSKPPHSSEHPHPDHCDEHHHNHHDHNPHDWQSKEKDNEGPFFWIIHHEIYNGTGYNTDSIPAGTAPKSFADLL
jgi:hypothetical protein